MVAIGALVGMVTSLIRRDGYSATTAGLVLAQNAFGFGLGRPTIVTGNSLSGEQSLGQGRDLAIMDGLGRRHIGAAQLWHGRVATLYPMYACGRDERLGGKPLVTLMEATDRWERDDFAGLGWVYRAALRTILVEREMRSRRVVVLKVRRQHGSQVTLIEDDDVIETLAAPSQ